MSNRKIIKYYFSFLNPFSFFRKKIEKIINKIDIQEKLKNTENKNNFQDLTTYKEEDERHLEYIEAIEWAVSNDAVKNIALSGYYGTGKSTILHKFKEKNKGHEYLSITLASFDENNSNNDKDFLKKIEDNIIHQIFYQEKQEKLKDSRFSRIAIKKLLFFKTVLILLYINTFLFFYKPEILNKLALIPISEDSVLRKFILVYFIFGLIYFLFKFLSFIFSFNLNEIGFSFASFSGKSSNKELSTLNKNIDEIIYFFEKTNTNIVFIEDLDRFNKPEIFVKLREINLFINNCKDVKQPVKFIYAIRDDIFSKNNQNKTKFFDFIIPVIPIINYKSSREFFFTELEPFLDEIGKDFIKQVSIYISDMRLLRNIVNEFKIYLNVKSKEKSDFNGVMLRKLFALILYKNVYPNDFVLLQRKEGLLYNVFNKKSNFIEKLTKSFKSKIEELLKEIEDVKEINEETEEQFRKSVAFDLMKIIPVKAEYFYKPDNNNKYDIIEKTTFEKILNDGFIVYSTNQNWIYYSNKIAISEKYNIRYKELLHKLSVNKGEIYKKLNYYKKKLDKINESHFFELLQQNENTEQQIDKIINEYLDKDIAEPLLPKKYDLIKLLIFEGYINEHYLYYISYFHEGSLNNNDYSYLIDIINNKKPKFTFEIDSVESFIEELPVISFSKKSILNYNILSQLVVGDSIHLNNFIKVLSNYSNQSLEFLIGYSEYTNKNRDTFVKFINRISINWPPFWDFVNLKIESPELKNRISEALLSALYLEDLLNLHNYNSFSEYLGNTDSILEDFAENFSIDELIKKVLGLNVRFKKLILNKVTEPYFDKIYSNNLYQFNLNNIKVIFEKLNLDLQNVEVANFTSILNHKPEKLIAYIYENPTGYLSFLNTLESNTKESEEAILEIIKFKDVPWTEELKGNFIKKQETKLSSLENIDQDNWKFLVENNLIKFSWENIFSYYLKSELEINETLVNFISNNIGNHILNKIFFEKLIEKDKTDTIKEFLLKLINRDIDVTILKELSKTFPKNIFEDTQVIDDIENADCYLPLMQTGVILLNKQNLDSLESKEYFDLYTKLISLNEDSEFIELIDELEFNEDVVVELLKSNSVSDGIKKELLFTYKNDFIHANNSVRFEMIGKVIVKMKYEDFDFEFLEIILKEITNNELKMELIITVSQHYLQPRLDILISYLEEPYKHIQERAKIKLELDVLNKRFVDSLKGEIVSRVFTNKKKQTISFTYKK